MVTKRGVLQLPPTSTGNSHPALCLQGPGVPLSPRPPALCCRTASLPLSHTSPASRAQGTSFRKRHRAAQERRAAAGERKLRADPRGRARLWGCSARRRVRAGSSAGSWSTGARPRPRCTSAQRADSIQGLRGMPCKAVANDTKVPFRDSGQRTEYGVCGGRTGNAQ